MTTKAASKDVRKADPLNRSERTMILVDGGPEPGQPFREPEHGEVVICGRLGQTFVASRRVFNGFEIVSVQDAELAYAYHRDAKMADELTVAERERAHYSAEDLKKIRLGRSVVLAKMMKEGGEKVDPTLVPPGVAVLAKTNHPDYHRAIIRWMITEDTIWCVASERGKQFAFRTPYEEHLATEIRIIDEDLKRT